MFVWTRGRVTHMASNRRRRFLIDSPVQLGLLRRLVLYAVYCLITATLLVFFWRLLHGGAGRTSTCWRPWPMPLRCWGRCWPFSPS